MTMGSRTSPEDGLLSLKWNNHRSTFLHILTGLRDKPLHSDVTLACSGELFPVHKLVLSSCSTYFASMFASTHCQHPVIVLKDIHKDELEALLDYMYIGEVDVKQSALEPLIRAAECLHIKGLAAPDEELPATRGTTSAGRGNSSGGDRRSTASNSSQQQQANGVGASSRGSKRAGGTNSGASDDDDVVDGPCSTVIKRRRRGSCGSPGVSAENSSSVTSVSVSYSSLSRGSRTRGGVDSTTPLQHSSTVIPNRDNNVRTSTLDDHHSRINQQQSTSKSGSHQQSQNSGGDDVRSVPQDSRFRQPAASPVTSEGSSSYGGASSQLLPSQIIKVELDDDRGAVGDGGERGGEEDGEPREVGGSGQASLSKERMDNRSASHGEEEEEGEDGHLMYNEAMNVVKVEEDEVEGRSRRVDCTEDGATSSKAEGESRPHTDWSDGGGEDHSSAPLGDDTHDSSAPKGTLATTKPIHHLPGPSSTSSPGSHLERHSQSSALFPASYVSSDGGEEGDLVSGSLVGTMSVEASGSIKKGGASTSSAAELDPWQLMCFGMATEEEDPAGGSAATLDPEGNHEAWETPSNYLNPSHASGGAANFETSAQDTGAPLVTLNPEDYMIQTANRHGRTTVVYYCSFCNKRFADKFNWNRHIVIHTGEKPFECEICGKRYSRKDKLKQHTRVHHNGDKRAK